MTEHLLTQSLSMIMVSAVAVGLFAALRMPAAMGYLLAGLAIGPYGLNLVALGDDTLFLAELGLIFLMFMVGLEFSLSTLLAARIDVLLAGSLQVGGTLATAECSAVVALADVAATALGRIRLVFLLSSSTPVPLIL